MRYLVLFILFSSVMFAQRSIIASSSYFNYNANSKTNPLRDILVDDYGANAYYKPLDGRISLGLHMPLITFTPYNQLSSSDSTILKLNGFLGSNYTKITADSAIFTSLDSGKTFCGLNNHLNETENFDSIDLYPPNQISARYATIIFVKDNDEIFVNFQFNGGNIETPQIQDSGKGYIFYDNSIALDSAWNEYNTLLNGKNKIILKTYKHQGNGVFSCYVAPTFYPNEQVNKNIVIEPNQSGYSRLKFGIEDYYGLQNDWGTQYYSNAREFLFDRNGDYNFIINNVQIVPPHSSYAAANPWGNALFGGQHGTNNKTITAVINGDNLIEKTEITAGDGITFERFVVQSDVITDAGYYEVNDNTALVDVNEFAYLLFEDCDFTGVSALGEGGGSSRGGLFKVWMNGSSDFENQQTWAPTLQEDITIKFTTNFSGLPYGLDTLSDLPSHCIEITSESGDWFKTLSAFNPNRMHNINVDSFLCYVTPWAFLQYAEAYLDTSKFSLGLPGNQNESISGKACYTSKKLFVNWEIPRKFESDGTTPKLYSVSRAYQSSQTSSQMILEGNGPPQVGVPIKNGIRTSINFSTVLGKSLSETTNNDKTWINDINRKPLMFQDQDQFKICAWVEVDNLTGLSVGDTVIGSISNDTAVIRYIDNHLWNQRLILGNATGAFTIGETILNSTIEDASTFDPTQVYTVTRIQRGNYPGNLVSTDTFSGTTYNYVGGEYAEGQRWADYQASTLRLTTNSRSYVYNDIWVTPNLPASINGNDDYQPLFEIEMVTSNFEYLLDTAERTATTWYNGIDKFASNQSLGDSNKFENEYLFGNYVGYGNGIDFTNTITGYKTANGWTLIPSYDLSTDAYGHLLYSTAEQTFYAKNWDFKNGYARRNNTTTAYNAVNIGNGTYLKPLAQYSKGNVFVNCLNLPTGQMFSYAVSSSNDQFENTRLIYAANPKYTPPYVLEFPYYPAKIWIYSPTASNPTNNITNAAENIITDTDTNNAPNPPESVYNLLKELEEL